MIFGNWTRDAQRWLNLPKIRLLARGGIVLWLLDVDVAILQVGVLDDDIFNNNLSLLRLIVILLRVLHLLVL